MADHLDRAKRNALRAAEHVAVPELSKTATDRAIMHALIDIAESLRGLRIPLSQPIYSDILLDVPLEHVGGVDDE